MGSPAYFGKLCNFTAGARRDALIPFGLFSPQDNLSFIASIPGPASTPALALIPLNSSAHMIINASLGNSWDITVTADITSTVLNWNGVIGNTPAGTCIYLRYSMNSNGGWAVSLPANLVIDTGFAIDPTPSRTTVLPIQWNGTNWVFFAAPFSVTGS